MTAFIPRARRPYILAQRAADAEKRAGRPAMDQALASISGAFGAAGKVNSFKLDVEAILKPGAGHARTKARYRTQIDRLAEMMPHVQSLNMACVIVDRWYRTERDNHRLLSVFGRQPDFLLTVLKEQRLILRWMRFKRMHSDFPAILSELAAPIPRPMLVEAAE